MRACPQPRAVDAVRRRERDREVAP